MSRLLLAASAIVGLLACSSNKDTGAAATPSGDSTHVGVVTDVTPPDAQWLDAASGAPIANWNTGPLAIPAAPPAQEPGVYDTGGRCNRGDLPTPASAIEKAVTAKGWHMVNHTRTIGDLSVVTAASEADGMCRPFSYQLFVFDNDRYAGTLSPVLMNARTDGALIDVTAGSGTNELIANYTRYKDDDPLCCASRTSRVTFQLARDSTAQNAVSRIVPASVMTEANPQ